MIPSSRVMMLPFFPSALSVRFNRFAPPVPGSGTGETLQTTPIRHQSIGQGWRNLKPSLKARNVGKAATLNYYLWPKRTSQGCTPHWRASSWAYISQSVHLRRVSSWGMHLIRCTLQRRVSSWACISQSMHLRGVYPYMHTSQGYTSYRRVCSWACISQSVHLIGVHPRGYASHRVCTSEAYIFVGEHLRGHVSHRCTPQRRTFMACIS